VQAAVTELLMEIQHGEKTTLLFISHDLSVVRYLADRVIVMYLGQIMEQGTVEEVFAPPYHPYTEALLSAVPIADARVRRRKIGLSGELPSPSAPPAGCPFSTRCPHSLGDRCVNTPPPVHEFTPTHHIACHIPRDQLMAMEPVMQIVPSADPVPSAAIHPVP
jgi:peptide/nickel transport system ATP-binding protein